MMNGMRTCHDTFCMVVLYMIYVQFMNQAASLTIRCEVLFNSLPLARKGSALIIAMVGSSQFPSHAAPSPAATPAPAPAPASPTAGGLPFVKYISDVNEAINEVYNS